MNSIKKSLSLMLSVIISCATIIASIGSVYALEIEEKSDNLYNQTVISSDDMDLEVEYSDEYIQYLEDLDNNDVEKYGEIVPSPLPAMDVENYVVEGEDTAPQASYLPSKYDPRENQMVTSVKNQGGRGLCWAFSALAGAESALLKDTGTNYDLSENYYNYLMAIDALGSSVVNPYSYNGRFLDRGGWSENVFYAMIVQHGALLESAFPYSKTGYLNNTDIFDSTPAAYAYGYDDFRAINGELTSSVMNDRILKIKKAIYENGSCNVYQDFSNLYSTYYNSTNHSLYIPTSVSTYLTHALCIVGWDDSYSRNKFNVTPGRDGAFIVKNSWGSYYGESGYYYLSYEDYFIFKSELSSIKDLTSEAKYDKMDSYTEYSPVAYTTSHSDSFYIANVYDAENFANQKLSAVGLQTLYPGAEFEIYVNPYNATLSSDSLINVYSGVAENAGYHTFELSTPIDIQSSDGKYAVAVKFLSDGSNSTTLNYMAGEYQSGVCKVANEGESFYSVNGNSWSDVSLNGNNFYINAYTNYDNECDNDTLSIRFYKPDSWGPNIKVHIWNTASYNTTWPGVAMKKIADGIYQYDNSSLHNCKIIINDGNGNQTSEFTVSGRVTIKNDKVIKRSSKPIEVQFKKPSNWGDDIKIYYYSNDTNNVERSAWPGESMKSIGQEYYTYTITDMESVRVIFTDGSGVQIPPANQPGIIVNAGQEMVYANNSYHYKKVSSLNILFKKPDSWGNNVYIHTWNSQNYDTTWPGTPMTLLSNGYYQYTNSNLYSCDAVITDGIGHQTGNLIDLVGCKTIINNKVIDNSESNIKVTFTKPSSWGNDVRVYYYTNDSNEISSISWPGYSMTNNGDGTYTYTIRDMAYVRVIFTDGTNQMPGANKPGYSAIAGQHLMYNNGNITYGSI